MKVGAQSRRFGWSRGSTLTPAVFNWECSCRLPRASDLSSGDPSRICCTAGTGFRPRQSTSATGARSPGKAAASVRGSSSERRPHFRDRKTRTDHLLHDKKEPRRPTPLEEDRAARQSRPLPCLTVGATASEERAWRAARGHSSGLRLDRCRGARRHVHDDVRVPPLCWYLTALRRTPFATIWETVNAVTPRRRLHRPVPLTKNPTCPPDDVAHGPHGLHLLALPDRRWGAAGIRQIVNRTADRQPTRPRTLRRPA